MDPFTKFNEKLKYIIHIIYYSPKIKALNFVTFPLTFLNDPISPFFFPDYKLANYDVKTRKQRWNITFSEYSASSFDGGLRRSDNEGSSQISGDKKDDILVKILASHDGRLLIHRKNDGEHL